MHKIDIGIPGNSTPFAVNEGFPKKFTSSKIPLAKCYHVEISKGEYILFQQIELGPFEIWYSEYLMKGPKILYSHQVPNNSIEFHAIIEGSVMYNFHQYQDHWYLESQGEHNILVNPTAFTQSAFKDLPVRTFDVHVKKEFFLELCSTAPRFKKLLPAIENEKLETLFTSGRDTEASLYFRYTISELLTLIREIPAKEQIATVTYEHIEKKLLTFILSFGQYPPPLNKELNLNKTELDTLYQIQSDLEKNYIQNQAIEIARKKYPMSNKKLHAGFLEIFGCTPKEYLWKIKVEKAKCFLNKNPTASNLEVALSVGYLDAKYFNKIFKKIENRSLSDFKIAFL